LFYLWALGFVGDARTSYPGVRDIAIVAAEQKSCDQIGADRGAAAMGPLTRDLRTGQFELGLEMTG
jgi:hypothetical protein